MIKSKLILIGGGGHCKSVIDVIEAENKYEIIGILDLKENLGKKILNYEIIGNDEDILKYANLNISFLITVGQINLNNKRINIYNNVKNSKGKFATIISPTAYVSKYSEIGVGTVIMHKVVTNINSKIGDNCIINTGAIIEHDVKIGNHNHISTNSTINGECEIGNNCFIGSSSVLKHCTKICDDVLVGAGSVVVKNVIEEGIYVGNPARKIR